MNKIYLNEHLCEDMVVTYEGSGMLKASADTLLLYNSFDEKHRQFFQNKSGKTLKLSRRESDLPGWFRVEIV
jgi:hypothetical protein